MTPVLASRSSSHDESAATATVRAIRAEWPRWTAGNGTRALWQVLAERLRKCWTRDSYSPSFHGLFWALRDVSDIVHDRANLKT
jgi:hypothetical protein